MTQGYVADWLECSRISLERPKPWLTRLGRRGTIAAVERRRRLPRLWSSRAVAGASVVAMAAALAGGSASATLRGSSLPLSARVLHAGDFLGLKPDQPPVVVRSAAVWTSNEPPGTFFNAKRLAEAGFAGGILEHLTWKTHNIDGVSVVVRLGSPAAAHKYLTIYNGAAPSFPVSGIPGVRGFGDSGGINVVFSDGDYAYLIGAGWQPGAKQQVTRTQLIAAAKLLYRRVHGH